MGLPATANLAWRYRIHVGSRTSIWLVVCQGRARRLRQADTARGCSPIQTIVNPLLGEPAANLGEQLGDLRWRRQAPVVEIPATVAQLADSAAVAPQSLGEQNRAQLVRCADPHPPPV